MCIIIVPATIIDLLETYALGEIMNGTISLIGKKKKEVVEILTNKNYKVIDGDKDYKYLRSLPVDSMEEENWKRLKNEEKNCQLAFVKLKKKTIEMMWVEELNELEEQYKKYQIARYKRVYGKVDKKKVKKIKKKKK